MEAGKFVCLCLCLCLALSGCLCLCFCLALGGLKLGNLFVCVCVFVFVLVLGGWKLGSLFVFVFVKLGSLWAVARKESLSSLCAFPEKARVGK